MTLIREASVEEVRAGGRQVRALLHRVHERAYLHGEQPDAHAS